MSLESWGTCAGGRASVRDRPRLATRQVRGRHRILVIRAPLTGLTQDRYRQDWIDGGTSGAGTEEGTQRGRPKLLPRLPPNLPPHEPRPPFPLPPTPSPRTPPP